MEQWIGSVHSKMAWRTHFFKIWRLSRFGKELFIYIYIYIILAADQNIFKLQLYNENGFKMHTLGFNLSISSKLEKRFRNYNFFMCIFPLFQGIISNWTIDSKAVSCTSVGYSFVIYTPIKQVKGLELILSVPFAFGSCCYEPTLCCQMISPYKCNRQSLGFKNKTNSSER